MAEAKMAHILEGQETRSQSQGSACAPARAPAFTCSACAVSLSWLPGFPVPELPAGWSRHGDQLLCIECQRQRIRDSSDEPLYDLIDMELKRDPDAQSKVVARRVGTGVLQVHERRRILIASGELRQPDYKIRRRRINRPGPKGERAEAALLADQHQHSDPELAQITGLNRKTLGSVRRRLEAEGRLPQGEGHKPGRKRSGHPTP